MSHHKLQKISANQNCLKIFSHVTILFPPHFQPGSWRGRISYAKGPHLQLGSEWKRSTYSKGKSYYFLLSILINNLHLHLAKYIAQVLHLLSALLVYFTEKQAISSISYFNSNSFDAT